MINIAVIILRDIHGKILLQFRDSGASSDPLCFSFFGGSIESDETPLQAICREVIEELSLTMSKSELQEVISYCWFEPVEKVEKQVTLFEYLEPISLDEFRVNEGAGAAFLYREEILKLDCISPLVRECISRHCTS